ncbi:gamma-glutamyltransferase family protein [Hyphomonas oceanitis]|uniref:gamma-glutamyltransferase family protein n=1 Tax=Hyphomonas oceanitis TaxID=81033 RepID=UPI003001F715
MSASTKTPTSKLASTADGPDRRQFLSVGTVGLAAGLAGALSAPSAFAQSGQKAPDAPESGATKVAAYRVETPGLHGVVSAGHPLAATAGLRILMQGGTAADAAVAVMATLNVVEPWASSIAGNGFATVHERATGKVKALKFGGAAPFALDPASDPSNYDWGVKAATTPGAFGGWIELARKHGKLSLAQCLAPAIDYARNGHPVDPSIARIIGLMQKKISLHPTTAAIYLPDGKPPEPRQLLKNEHLAQTFESLVKVEQGALASGADRDGSLKAALDYFYKGPIAREIDRFFKEVGGWLRYKDMAAYKAEWADPVSTSYRGYNVFSSPLTSRGGLEVCMQLNLIERFDMAALGRQTASSVHVMAEAIKLAKADIYAYAADPAFANTPVKAMLSGTYAAQRTAMISPTKARSVSTPTDFRAIDPSAPPSPPEPVPFKGDTARFSDTASFTVVDRTGDTVVVTVTLGGGFGTGVVAGNTGFLLNNGMRLGSTSPYPNSVNFVEPGKIPILNNSPTIVMKGQHLVAAFGTPGGETIGQSEFQFLVNVLDHGMGVQEAIEAPRFAVKADPSFYMPSASCVLQMESRYDEGVADKLRSLGHDVKQVGPLAIGSLQGACMTADGIPMAGADPRRMAMAAGW